MAEPTEPEGPACHSYGDGLGVQLPPEVLDQMAAGMNALDRECAEAEAERHPLAEPVPLSRWSAMLAAAAQPQAAPEYQPPMNAEERARRAEALANRLAVALSLAKTFCTAEDLALAYDAAEAWAEHRARLDAQGVPR